MKRTIIMRTVLGLLAVLSFTLSMSCSPEAQLVDGGTLTETTNCGLRGILYGPDGLPAESGVKVRIHPRQTLADTSDPDYALYDTATVFTDSLGRFVIDSLNAGLYVIEADNGTNYVLIDSVVFVHPDSELVVVDTLRAPGAISGVIDLSAGGDPRAMLIVIWGLERMGQVAADGSFSLGTLAKGRYTLRFIPLMGGYGIVDVPGVLVAPGETTTMDTVRIPYTGIPIPSDPQLTYDTLEQVVTLSWNRTDSLRVVGYNVYRAHLSADHAIFRLNGDSPVIDTAFSDTTAVAGESYEYRVTAIDTTGAEGLRSAGARVTLYSPFVAMDSLMVGGGSTGVFTRLAVGPGGALYVTDVTNHRLLKLTPSGEVAFSLTSFESPQDVALGSDGVLYVLDLFSKKVVKIDTAGTVLKSWTTAAKPISVAVVDGLVYVASGAAVAVFDTAGVLKTTIPLPNESLIDVDFVADGQDRILLNLDNTLYRIDPAADTLSLKFEYVNTQQRRRLTSVPPDLLCILSVDPNVKSHSTIDVYTGSGELLISWNRSDIFTDIQYVGDQTVVVVSKDGKFLYLRMDAID